LGTCTFSARRHTTSKHNNSNSTPKTTSTNRPSNSLYFLCYAAAVYSPSVFCAPYIAYRLPATLRRARALNSQTPPAARLR
jgi:hypothetical protein